MISVNSANALNIELAHAICLSNQKEKWIAIAIPVLLFAYHIQV